MVTLETKQQKEYVVKEEINLTKKGISGIGIDIEEISRFRKLKFNQNKHFYEKIFVEKEIKYCLSKQNPYPHFAARFCAKEAFIKAIKAPIDYKDIEIKFEKNTPFIACNNKKYFLSLSHDKHKAIAFVIA